MFSGQDSWGPDAPPPSGNPVVRVFDDVLSGLGLHSDQTYYIKRVIGLPSDHVACCTDGRVTVNGVRLDEGQYLFPGNPPSTFKFSVVVPPGTRGSWETIAATPMTPATIPMTRAAAPSRRTRSSAGRS